ncbi:MAG: ABC-2 type transport system permease protein [Acidimicrobiales bacterium]
MNIWTQLKSQAGFDLLTFRRNPAATFFTVVLPLVFLVLFTSIFGNETIDSRNGARVATFYVPGILAMSLVSATMINLAITTTTRREQGILKRIRGTPLRPWVFVAAQVLAAVVIMAFSAFLVITIGWLLFDVSLQAKGVPALLISLVVGTATFSALGLALATIIPSVNAAPAITNAIALPLYFVSDVFIISDDSPRVINTIGNLFPIKHLGGALQESFNPFIEGTPMPWGHWAVIAGWGLVGAIVSVTRFRWTPWGS